MKDSILEKLADLIDAKPLIALGICITFCVCVFRGLISSDVIQNAFYMVLGWYGGKTVTESAQPTRLPDKTDG